MLNYGRDQSNTQDFCIFYYIAFRGDKFILRNAEEEVLACVLHYLAIYKCSNTGNCFSVLWCVLQVRPKDKFSNICLYLVQVQPFYIYLYPWVNSKFMDYVWFCANSQVSFAVFLSLDTSWWQNRYNFPSEEEQWSISSNKYLMHGKYDLNF